MFIELTRVDDGLVASVNPDLIQCIIPTTHDGAVLYFATGFVTVKESKPVVLELIRSRHGHIFNTLDVQITRDGNQWCVLYGENLQEGVAGFGDTLQHAINHFDKNFSNRITVPPSNESSLPV